MERAAAKGRMGATTAQQRYVCVLLNYVVIVF